MAESIEDDLKEMAEELFPPKAGGMVDSTRRQNAKASAGGGDAVTVQPFNPKAVRTVAQAPGLSKANTVIVPTAAYNAVRVLGYDENRKTATILTLDQPVVVAVSQGQANDNRNYGNAAGLSAGGFVLPVNVPFVIQGASEVWVAATSATASRVSVWSDVYSDG
jgi:hypothetical protein